MTKGLAVGASNKSHTYHYEYDLWRSMIKRCENPRDKDWNRYGARGIRVCERWKDFDLFIADMGRRPSRQHSIDRHPDNDGNYEPTNCRWATASEQARNRRTTRWISSAEGERMPLIEWAKRLGISPQSLGWRLKKQRLSDALLPGPRPNKSEPLPPGALIECRENGKRQRA
jgi:hypothetical protein